MHVLSLMFLSSVIGVVKHLSVTVDATSACQKEDTLENRYYPTAIWIDDHVCKGTLSKYMGRYSMYVVDNVLLPTTEHVTYFVFSFIGSDLD